MAYSFYPSPLSVIIQTGSDASINTNSSASSLNHGSLNNGSPIEPSSGLNLKQRTIAPINPGVSESVFSSKCKDLQVMFREIVICYIELSATQRVHLSESVRKTVLAEFKKKCFHPEVLKPAFESVCAELNKYEFRLFLSYAYQQPNGKISNN